MKLKLKHAIRVNKKQYLPPIEIDTKEIGISDAEADLLVRGGGAEKIVEAADVETDEQRQAREAAEAAAKAEEEARTVASAEPEVVAAEPAPEQAAAASGKTSRKR